MAFPHISRALARFAIIGLILGGICVVYDGFGLLFDFIPVDWSVASGNESFPGEKVLRDLSLTEAECRGTFPGLMDEIDEAVSRGPFQLERQRDGYTGLVQGRIEDGKLFVISFDKHPNRDMAYGRNAVLHALHRAIITSPEPLPNTTFTFSITDNPSNNSWSFSRSNDPAVLGDGNYWVMPHFAFWSWPKPFIGTVDQALSKISKVEEQTPWEKKEDKVVWRGTTHFNSVGNINLRPKLLEVTKDKEWADVQAMQWMMNAEKATNSIEIEDFCRYKYIIYTEGITYSGRLPFHQACESIILTPPPNYLLHTTHFMRPLFSSSFLRPLEKSEPNQRWPNFYSTADANIIFLDPEWNDLEATVMWLREHPDVAKGIAKRQHMDMKRGYLSEAAEVCYWRSLVKGWSEVVRTDDEKWRLEGGDGIRWETFSLTGSTTWD